MNWRNAAAISKKDEAQCSIEDFPFVTLAHFQSIILNDAGHTFAYKLTPLSRIETLKTSFLNSILKQPSCSQC